MFKILDLTKGNLIAFKVKGKIEKADYDKLNALLEKNEKEYDKQRLYIEISIDDIEGIEPSALWEDIKTYFKEFRNLEKTAIVGESKLVKNLSQLSKPFVSGQLKFFDEKETVAAKEWISDDVKTNN